MAQIGYVCLGSNDFDRACGFYDALTGELGGKKLFPTPHGQMYRLGSGAMIMVTRPYNEAEAHPGNGTMLAINVDAQADVARVYEKALSLGQGGPADPERARALGSKVCKTGIISTDVYLESKGLCK